MDGRPSLFPDIDFCSNPEAVCSSQHSNELQWVVGMFHWIKVVQSYNENGWSYMDNLGGLPLDIADSRFHDMLTAVDCIMKTGKHRCNIGVDSIDTLKKVLAVITDERIDPNAPTMPPTVTPMPTVSPPTGEDIYWLIVIYFLGLCMHTHTCSLTIYSQANAATNGFADFFLCTKRLAEYFRVSIGREHQCDCGGYSEKLADFHINCIPSRIYRRFIYIQWLC